MDPVAAGALFGIGGTLLGVITQERLTVRRERRHELRMQRRAVRAIVGELITTVWILDKALERQAWWPEGDEPRSEEWQRYRDYLGEELDTESLMRIGFVYESVRSLAATRSSPLSPAGRGKMRRLLRDDPQGRSFFSLIWTADRWPSAAEETRDTRDLVWEILVDTLRPVEQRLLGNVWQLPERGAPEPPHSQAVSAVQPQPPR